MNTNAVETTDLSNDPGLRVPIYFPTAEKRLFGWLHYPASRNANCGLGLVICNPFGYEAICAHRSMRAIAEAVADLGIPVLRFDYQGAGDSGDIGSEADQMAVWVGDVMAAADELKRLTGVEGICLLGTRLGGLLAIEAARQCGSVHSLILIEPVVTGLSYLREMRRVRLAASLGGGQQVVPANVRQEEIEVSGFSLSSATVAALIKTDLMTLDAPPAPGMLIIDRADLPSARKWSEAMSRKEARVASVTLPGFVEMIMTPAESATIPVAMIEKIREWLPGAAVQQPLGSTRIRDRVNERDCTAYNSVMQIPCIGGESGSPLTEYAIRFGPDEILFGIVTKPYPGEVRKRAVIFLNTGAVHHVGLSRSAVSLARKWAQSGYLSLRMDLAGIGDSETRPGRPLNEVFTPTAVEEIREAVELVRTRYGIQDISLVGVCAGATHALHAAVAGLPVSRILLANPMIFFWKSTVTNNDIIRISEAMNNPTGYRSRIFSALHWKRLLTGQVQLAVIPRVYLHRFLMAVKSTLREVARRINMHLPDDLGWELESIAARGVKSLFVFAPGEPGIELLRIEAGSSLSKLGDRCRVRIIEGADHAFSQQGPRSRLEEILSEELLSQ